MIRIIKFLKTLFKRTPKVEIEMSCEYQPLKGADAIRSKMRTTGPTQILIVTVPSSVDGPACLGLTEADALVKGEVQDYWNWHFPVNYNDTVLIEYPVDIPIPTSSTLNWVFSNVVGQILGNNNQTYADYQRILVFLPIKAYGWIGSSGINLAVIASPPEKMSFTVIHELGHTYGLTHSASQFFENCAYQPYKPYGGDDIMGGQGLRKLNPKHLDQLNILNVSSSLGEVHWLNPVDVDKSAIEFADDHFVYHRLDNGKFNVVKGHVRQALQKDILPDEEQVYITDSGHRISWGGYAGDYITIGKTRLYGADLNTLHPQAIPVIITPGTPCV